MSRLTIIAHIFAMLAFGAMAAQSFAKRGKLPIEWTEPLILIAFCLMVCGTLAIIVEITQRPRGDQ